MQTLVYRKGANPMSLLPYLALGLIGMFMVWRGNRRHKDLTEQVERLGSRIYQLRRELETAQEKAEQTNMALQYDILTLKGDLKITAEMPIGDIISNYPQAQQVLAGFHIGGCDSCSVDNHQPLGEAVFSNGRDIQPILVALNTLVLESNGHGQVDAARLKMPNVKLEF